jgi:hypothetical protein
MNTLGKLLVVANLVAALAVGAFLAIDYTSRVNWKEVAEHRADELNAIKKSTEADQKTKQDLKNENLRLQGELDAKMIHHNGVEGQLRLEIDRQKGLVLVHKEASELAILNHAKSIEEAKRLAAEVVLLVETVKKREAEILQYQQKNAEYAQKYTEKELEAKTAVARAQNLFQQLKEKEIYIANILARGGAGDASKVVDARVRDANFQNPPPVNVRGLINAVDKDDRSLVQITIGSDAGLQKDHTLEVYRLSPSVQYLGTLRLLDVRHDVAIGRVVRPPSMTNVPGVVEGDQVSTRLNP